MKKIIIVVVSIILVSVTFAQPSNTECIAPASPGGGWDFTCRVPAAQVMQELDLISGAMKVTNMSGGGGGVAMANVITQRSDDDNLIVAASSATATRLAQNQYAGFTADDVRWLGALGSDFGVLAVAADSPINNLAELIGVMKILPESVTFVGGSAVGGYDHIKFLLAAHEAGIDDVSVFNYVSFDGGGPALLELKSGRADVFSGDTSEVLGDVQAGLIKVITVFSPEKVSSLKGVRTAKSQGYNVIAGNWRGFYGPPNMSDEAYNYWVSAIQQVANSPEWVTLREESGLAPFARFGADFEGFVKDRISRIESFSRMLGIIE